MWIPKKIKQSPCKLYGIITGGGTTFISDFLCKPGASNTILGFEVPYGKDSIVKLLGKEPEKYVSETTALQLATKAYSKVVDHVLLPPVFGNLHDSKLSDLERHIFDDNVDIVGLGVTASLATDNEREGRKNQVYVALHSREFSMVAHMEMQDQSKDRATQDWYVSNLIYSLIYDFVYVEMQIEKSILKKLLKSLMN